MSIIAPEIPDDGYDICASCNYLEPVADVMMMDDGSGLIPLCADCSHRIHNGIDIE